MQSCYPLSHRNEETFSLDLVKYLQRAWKIKSFKDTSLDNDFHIQCIKYSTVSINAVHKV